MNKLISLSLVSLFTLATGLTIATTIQANTPGPQTMVMKRHSHHTAHKPVHLSPAPVMPAPVMPALDQLPPITPMPIQQ